MTTKRSYLIIEQQAGACVLYQVDAARWQTLSHLLYKVDAAYWQGLPHLLQDSDMTLFLLPPCLEQQLGFQVVRRQWRLTAAENNTITLQQDQISILTRWINGLLIAIKDTGVDDGQDEVYKTMAARGREFLEEESTPENTAAWLYKHRLTYAALLYTYSEKLAMTRPVRNAIDHVYHFCEPLSQELEQGKIIP